MNKILSQGSTEFTIEQNSEKGGRIRASVGVLKTPAQARRKGTESQDA